MTIIKGLLVLAVVALASGAALRWTRAREGVPPNVPEGSRMHE